MLAPRTLHPPTRHAVFSSILHLPVTSGTFGPQGGRTVLLRPREQALGAVQSAFSYLVRHVGARDIASTWRQAQSLRSQLLTTRGDCLRKVAAHTLAHALAHTALPPSAANLDHLRALAALRAHPSSVDVETTIQASLALRSDILGALPFEAVLALSKFLSPRFWVSAVGVVLTRALDGFRSFGITLDALVCTFVRHQLASLAKTDNDVIFRLQGEHFQEKGSPDLESSWNPARIQAESHARGIDLVYSATFMRCDADRFAPPAHDSEKLRLALVEWATLHIKYGVPSIMLVLSSAVMASRAQLYTEGPLLAPRCQASDTSNRIANRIGPIPKLLPVSHSSVNGFAVCLHNLLTHIPGGLDTPHRLGIAI